MMQPYYQDDLVTLYHGDAREIQAWTEADTLVMDPPYGRAWRQGEVKFTGSAKAQARNKASLTGIANDSTTEVRDAALAMWGAARRAIVFGDLMLAPPVGTKLVGVYHKADLAAGLRGAIGGIRRDVEAIYLLGKWPSGIGGRSSVFPTGRQITGSHGIVAQNGGHPHTKAGNVMEELIALSEGSVADPFAGSGSTLAAAKRLGRKAIGVELEESYCELIAKRLSADVLDFGETA